MDLTIRLQVWTSPGRAHGNWDALSRSQWVRLGKHYGLHGTLWWIIGYYKDVMEKHWWNGPSQLVVPDYVTFYLSMSLMKLTAVSGPNKLPPSISEMHNGGPF